MIFSSPVFPILLDKGSNRRVIEEKITAAAAASVVFRRFAPFFSISRMVRIMNGASEIYIFTNFSFSKRLI